LKPFQKISEPAFAMDNIMKVIVLVIVESIIVELKMLTMKTLGIILAGIFCVHTVSVAQQQDVRVQSSPGVDQQTYSSFYFLDDVGFQQGTEMDHRSGEERLGTDQQHQQHQQHQQQHQHHQQMMGMTLMADDAIRNAILHEMVSRGFEIDSENPDLLINYQVFDQSAEISGFTADDPTPGAPGVGTTQMPETVEVGEGTILITVTDRESGEMISRGFISEALDLQKFHQEGEFQDERAERYDHDRAKKYEKKVEVIQSVASIFNQLQLGDTAPLGAGR
jgi:hypothetical protein